MFSGLDYDDDFVVYNYFCHNCKQTFPVENLVENKRGITVCGSCGSSNHSEKD